MWQLRDVVEYVGLKVENDWIVLVKADVNKVDAANGTTTEHILEYVIQTTAKVPSIRGLFIQDYNVQESDPEIYKDLHFNLNWHVGRIALYNYAY
ncbi:hypothetical protein FOL47_004412 [Perkinsus chesapeaki]|uniref:Uncharacterized protein n=1 Tax=Perkinsus chesapeaki TaxID=330153 RepID=A0A7J6M2T3_PERCH|nr:hypothetical protein FOL47_004412 [Perkinsus chesapeaki]